MLVNKIHLSFTVKERSRPVIQSYRCEQKGRRVSWETGVQQVGFQVFPEGCDRGAISFWKETEFQRTGA